MDYLPLFIDLRGRRVLVVGGGDAAARKISLLRQTPAEIIVVEPSAFVASAVDGAAIVFAATGDASVDAAVAAAAHAANVPVNIADRADLSSFIMPSIIDRDPVVIAVSSGGTAPALARWLRERLDRQLHPQLGALARFIGRLRARVNAAVPVHAERYRFWKAFLNGPAARTALEGNEAAAEAHLARLDKRDLKKAV